MAIFSILTSIISVVLVGPWPYDNLDVPSLAFRFGGHPAEGRRRFAAIVGFPLEGVDLLVKESDGADMD